MATIKKTRTDMKKCSNKEIGVLLTDYMFDRISDEDRNKIEAHLLECSACFEEQYNFQPIADLMMSIPGEEMVTNPNHPSLLSWLFELPKVVLEGVRHFGWKRAYVFAFACLVFVALIPVPNISKLGRFKHQHFVVNASLGHEQPSIKVEVADIYNRHQYDKAISLLDQLAKSDSINYLYLGIAYAKIDTVNVIRSNLKKSIISFKLALPHAAENVKPLINFYIANAYIKLDDKKTALMILDELTKGNDEEIAQEAKKIISAIKEQPTTLLGTRIFNFFAAKFKKTI